MVGLWELSMGRIDRRVSPRPLGDHDVLTVGEVARELKIRDADARRWVDEQELVVLVAGRRRVIWGQVIETLRAQQHPWGPRAVMKQVGQTDRFG